MVLDKTIQTADGWASLSHSFNRDMSKLNGANGAALIVKSLEMMVKNGVAAPVIAGHHGGAILPFFEQFAKSNLFQRYIHVPKEDIAGHIAEGYAKVSGKVGVAITTSGPGATNIITAFYDAFMDSIPLVVISGNVAQAVKGTMAFQEAPIDSMIAQVAKEKYYVANADEIPRLMFEAFQTAATGRPGPVWIDVPKDVQLSVPEKLSLHIHPYEFNAPPNDYELAAHMITHAKRPVIYAGAGVKANEGWRQLRALANRYKIPVTTTLLGKGAFPERHDLSLGMLGMHGTETANYAVDQADVLIALGARFDDRVTGDPSKFAKDAYIIDLNIDPRGIGAYGRTPQLVLQDYATRGLSELMRLTKQGDHSEWLLQIQKWKNENALQYDRESAILKPQHVMELLAYMIGMESAIVTGVGQHQMWAAQFCKLFGPRFLSSGGSGTMGYGLPAALGAQLATQDELRSEYFEYNIPTWLVDGDESFMMTVQTLALYQKMDIDVKVLVLNNKEPDGNPGGMVNQWYKLVHNDTQLPVKDGPSIAEVSRGFGIIAEVITTEQKAYTQMNIARTQRGPVVLEFRVDPNEMCLPMIPSGKCVAEMVTYRDLHK